MAGLDRRDPPTENRTVTAAYLDELYAKADRLRQLEAYLHALDRDPEFRCSIGGLEEWLHGDECANCRRALLGVTPAFGGIAVCGRADCLAAAQLEAGCATSPSPVTSQE